MIPDMGELERRLARAYDHLRKIPEDDQFAARFTLEEVDHAFALGLRRLAQAERLIKKAERRPPQAVGSSAVA